jgi:hypothetical protein
MRTVSCVDMRLTPHESDIFRFTLYWTLIFYLFLFGLPGLWALLVHLLPQRQWTPISDGTALRRIPSTPRYHNHNTHPYASLEDLPLPSPAFSPSPHPSSADVRVQGATQPSTSGQLRFAEPQPPTPVSPVSSPVPSRGWDSWTPSIRLRDLRSRSRSFSPNVSPNANANAPQDHETASTVPPPPPPPTSLTPFSLSYIPASRPASSIIPGTNSTSPKPVPALQMQMPPIQPPPRLSRFRKSAKSNLLLVLLIPLVFVLVGAVIGLSGSLVIGYLLAALKDSSDVRISTWLPLGWAVIQALVILSG